MGCSAGAIIYLLLESSVPPAHCCHIFPASLLPAGNAAAAGRQAAAVPAAAAPRPRAAAAGVGWSGCGWAGVCAWQAWEPRSLSCQRSLSLPMGILQYSASHQATAVGDSSLSLFSLCRAPSRKLNPFVLLPAAGGGCTAAGGSDRFVRAKPGPADGSAAGARRQQQQRRLCG